VTRIDYPDREALAMGLADRLASALRACLDTQDRASLCVPGGTSPGDTFAILSGAALDWSRIDVLLGDERWVPEGHPRSNTALLRRTLLIGKAAAATHIPLVSDAPTPEAGLPALLPGVEGALPLSVLLLGIGTDGHTASLFPGGDTLAAAMGSDAPALMAMRAPGAEEPRVTLTAPVLHGAMATHMIAMGKEKREALERAARADPMDMPAAAFLGEATIHWAP
jgi:6-phosphogluconolactonase